MPAAQFLGGFARGIDAHQRMLAMRAQQQQQEELRAYRQQQVALAQEREQRIAEEHAQEMFTQAIDRMSGELTDLAATGAPPLELEQYMQKNYEPVFERLSPSERTMIRERSQLAGEEKRLKLDQLRNETLLKGITTEQAIRDAKYKAQIGNPKPFDMGAAVGYLDETLANTTDLPAEDRAAARQQIIDEVALQGGGVTWKDFYERTADVIKERKKDYLDRQQEERAQGAVDRAESSESRQRQKFEISSADRPFSKVIDSQSKTISALEDEIKAMEKTVVEDKFVGGIIALDETGHQIVDPEEESKVIGEYVAKIHKLRKLTQLQQAYQQVEAVRATGDMVAAIRAAKSLGLSRDDPYVQALKRQYEGAE